MATLYVTEYSGAVGNAIAVTPRIRTNNVAIGAVAASVPFSANTNLVRLHADAICSFRFSQDPGVTSNATTADARMAADSTEYFAVRPGDIVSVISNT